jgi:hypothetical protein
MDLIGQGITKQHLPIISVFKIHTEILSRD